MSYTTVANVKGWLPEYILSALTSETPEGERATVDAIIEQAIAFVDSEIDASLGVRYTVPIESPPAIIETLATTGVRLWLYSRVGGEAGMIDISAERVLYMNYLRDLSRGYLILPGISVKSTMGSFSAREKIIGAVTDLQYGDTTMPVLPTL